MPAQPSATATPAGAKIAPAADPGVAAAAITRVLRSATDVEPTP
jgi:hypothetical protein